MRMNAKDTVAGTAKKLVAEIVGDGKLAEEEGARKADGSHSIPAPIADADSSPKHPPTRRAILHRRPHS
jgi:hypothetical protein